MRYRRQIQCRRDAARFEHERRGMTKVEVVANEVFEHGRSERTKGLSFLDPRIDQIAHGRRAGVGEDRPPAERARTELHSALEPSHDLSLDESVDCRLQE